MENNPEEPTVVPVKEEPTTPSSLAYMKGWWGDYQQFVAGAVFGVSAILLGSFLRSRRN
jgi:hypothetical protein